jgi:Tfp pilus assembly protein PilO
MKPKQFFFMVLGVLVLVVVGGGAGYFYGLKLVKAQSANLSVMLAEQKVADEQIDSLQKLDAKYHKEIIPIQPLIDASLPRSKQQTEILAQIERLAGANGMTLSGATMPGPTGLPSEVSQTIKSGAVLALPINFHISGTYAQLETFTSQLENLNRFTNITTLQVHRDRDTAADATYTMNLNAYIKP